MCVVYYWSVASMFSSHQGREVRIEGEKLADATTTVVNGSGVLCDGGRKDDAKKGP